MLAAQTLAADTVAYLQSQFNYTDEDLLLFLLNTECLEADFDSWAAFGVPLDPTLSLNGPPAIGHPRKANLSATIQPIAEEIARDEAGHVRLIREVLPNAPPCPQLDFTGFQGFFNSAFNTTNVTWDPFADDLHFLLSTFTLEEVGASGDKGAALFMTNKTLLDAVTGLAGSAAYQSAIDRLLLWERQTEIVNSPAPFNVPVSAFFAALSARRDAVDGPVIDDQPLIFDGGINLVPTDGNGLTLSRTPQQVLAIATNGSPNGRGGFFPNGVQGRINTTTPLSNPSTPPALLAMANAPYTISSGTTTNTSTSAPAPAASTVSSTSATAPAVSAVKSAMAPMVMASGRKLRLA